ncbi:unnamed protein product (macronuclear) [Paramecium tetraurelia]|uniref:Intimal thickness related receptor IRP domain-containing protein n=1 Tax=Paramecium tetraurelia TaxID=5888 RepID=A0DJ65_PARTE|nr:uncharacterized protein GSPATT00017439001 [Paramecium tetraurelia]CAK83082.1 unnamed protein product [Paramecium tetraurelia]|eukprot:XP_001450479.1 hypothetical protein (macronuclear) [Paramecium tetraurelia strain d4-2]
MKDANDEYLVYDKNKISFEFLPENLNQGVTCKPPRSFGILSTNNGIGISNQTLRIENDDIISFNVFVLQMDEKNTNINLQTEVISDDDKLKPKSEILFRLSQQCPQRDHLTSQNYWTPIHIQVSLNEVNQQTHELIEFAIIFSCDKSYRDITFDWSLPILLVISTILIAFLAKYTRILSFSWKTNGKDFQGFEINNTIILIYILLYAGGATIVLATDFLDFIRYLFIIIACTIGTLAIFFVSSELACLMKANSFLRKYYIVFSSIISLLIGIPYYFYKPWYLSDIISLAFIVLIVKFFRLKNFKFASFLMISNVLLDSTLALIIHYTQVESYNTTVLQFLNCPLELQLPLISLQFNKNCAWISLFSQAVPGLLLSLAYRIDKTKRTFTYGLQGFLSLIIAEGLWVLATVSVKHSIPETIFTYPILLGTLTLNSLRRAEFNSFWFGDYLTDQSFQRLRGDSLIDAKAPDLLFNVDIIPDSKVQPTDL